MKFRKLNNEDLTKVLNIKMQELDPKQMLTMLDDITGKLAKFNGASYMKKFSSKEIVAAILLEAYMRGYQNALVQFNEAIGDIMQEVE